MKSLMMKMIPMKSKLLSKITGIACMVIVFFSTILATELLDDIVNTIQDKLDDGDDDRSKTVTS